MLKLQIMNILMQEQNDPCVTISLQTHKKHPENEMDRIVFKNLLIEAIHRVNHEYVQRSVNNLLHKLYKIEQEIDWNQNWNSLHIFLSNTVHEVIKSSWPLENNTVQIGEQFALNPLFKMMNRSESYLILLLSQSGVKLYHAINDEVVEEINNEDFPMTKNMHYLTHQGKLSDPKQVDNMVREFLNVVDKAMVRVNNEMDLKCIVVCTDDNYIRLMKVADKPYIYETNLPINYNDTSPHSIVKDAWEIVKTSQSKQRAVLIAEMLEAVGTGKVITDLSEIYKAAKEGRGDLLLVKEDFQQPVKMTSESTFDLVENSQDNDVIDDITQKIAMDIIAQKGRVIFTKQESMQALGGIALKVRY